MGSTSRCSIIEVHYFLGDDACQVPLDTACMDSQDFLQSSAQTVKLLMDRAAAAAGDQAVKRLVYKDDEGDLCSFNLATLSDAMQFVVPVGSSTDVGRLDLFVVLDAAVTKESPRKVEETVTEPPCQGMLRILETGEERKQFTAELQGKRVLHVKGFGSSFKEPTEEQQGIEAEQKLQAVGAIEKFLPDYLVVDGDPWGAGFQLYLKSYLDQQQSTGQQVPTLIWAKDAKLSGSERRLIDEKEREKKQKKAQEYVAQGFQVVVYYIDSESLDQKINQLFGKTFVEDNQTAKFNARGLVKITSEKDLSWVQGVSNPMMEGILAIETPDRGNRQYFEKCSFENAAKGNVIFELLHNAQSDAHGVACFGGGESVMLELATKYLNEDSADLHKDLAVFSFTRGRDDEDPRLPSHLGASFVAGEAHCLSTSADTEAAVADEVQSPAPDKENISTLESAAICELNSLAKGVDMRCLVPKLAGVALSLVQEYHEPALFEVIEPLVDFKEGKLQAKDLPSVLPKLLAVKEGMSSEVASQLLDRFRERAAEQVSQLQTESSKDQSGVEVHLKICCDGCNVSPIVGRRYKSLEYDNYDLCRTCFESSDRDPQQWVRVESKVLGDVVSSYYGEAQSAGETGPVHPAVQCDGCGMNPLKGRRYRCTEDPNFDLCSECRASYSGDKQFDELINTTTSFEKEDVVPLSIAVPKLDAAPEASIQDVSESSESPEQAPTQNVEEPRPEPAVTPQTISGRGTTASPKVLKRVAHRSAFSTALAAASSLSDLLLAPKCPRVVQTTTYKVEPAATSPVPQEAADAASSDCSVDVATACSQQSEANPTATFVSQLNGDRMTVSGSVMTIFCKGEGAPIQVLNVAEPRFTGQFPWGELEMVLEGRNWRENGGGRALWVRQEEEATADSESNCEDLISEANVSQAGSSAEESTVASRASPTDMQHELRAQLEQMRAQLEEALARATAAELAIREAQSMAEQARTEMEAAKEAAANQIAQAIEVTAQSQAELEEAASTLAAAEMDAAQARAELQAVKEASANEIATASQQHSDALKEAMSTAKAARVAEQTALSELAALKESTAEQAKAAMKSVTTASASVLSSAPLMLGIEAHEEEKARGDITASCDTSDEVRQVFRLGRLMMASGMAETVPASAAIVVKNDGKVQWPTTAAVVSTSGDCLGFPLLPLGPLQPGEAAEVVMDLVVPPHAKPCSADSSWCLVDASTGALLGPKLVLEMVWLEQ